MFILHFFNELNPQLQVTQVIINNFDIKTMKELLKTRIFSVMSLR